MRVFFSLSLSPNCARFGSCEESSRSGSLPHKKSERGDLLEKWMAQWDQCHLCHNPTQTGRLCLRSVSAVLMNGQNFSCFFPNGKLENQVLLVRDGATGVLQLLRNLRPSHGDPATLEMQIEHVEHVNFAWPSAANWLILRGLLSRHSGFWSLCFSPANWHGTKQVLIRWSFHWQVGCETEWGIPL